MTTRPKFGGAAAGAVILHPFSGKSSDWQEFKQKFISLSYKIKAATPKAKAHMFDLFAIAKDHIHDADFGGEFKECTEKERDTMSEGQFDEFNTALFHELCLHLSSAAYPTVQAAAVVHPEKGLYLWSCLLRKYENRAKETYAREFLKLINMKMDPSHPDDYFEQVLIQAGRVTQISRRPIHKADMLCYVHNAIPEGFGYLKAHLEQAELNFEGVRAYICGHLAHLEQEAIPRPGSTKAFSVQVVQALDEGQGDADKPPLCTYCKNSRKHQESGCWKKAYDEREKAKKAKKDTANKAGRSKYFIYLIVVQEETS
jgi:hypothetical protein